MVFLRGPSPFGLLAACTARERSPSGQVVIEELPGPALCGTASTCGHIRPPFVTTSHAGIAAVAAESTAALAASHRSSAGNAGATVTTFVAEPRVLASEPAPRWATMAAAAAEALAMATQPLMCTVAIAEEPDSPALLGLLARAELAREGQHVYAWRGSRRVLTLSKKGDIGEGGLGRFDLERPSNPSRDQQHQQQWPAL
mmetsp:Transcript_83827/g.218251  ORF Transcript_83827/g.218251 Transcript_83827/m.218251 type:complete len:200 (+) Transcript_83827:79-678(+)